jgi:hypothetical protein
VREIEREREWSCVAAAGGVPNHTESHSRAVPRHTQPRVWADPLTRAAPLRASWVQAGWHGLTCSSPACELGSGWLAWTHLQLGAARHELFEVAAQRQAFVVHRAGTVVRVPLQQGAQLRSEVSLHVHSRPHWRRPASLHVQNAPHLHSAISQVVSECGRGSSDRAEWVIERESERERERDGARASGN